MTDKEELTQLVEDSSEEDAIIMLCVSLFLRDMENAASDPAYKEDAERKDLVKALCTATGVTPDSLLAKLLLCYADGFEAGLEFRDKIEKAG